MSLRSLRCDSAFPPARYLARLCHQTWGSELVLPCITQVPVLFLSGLRDEIVPWVLLAYSRAGRLTSCLISPAHMRHLYEICRAQKKIWKAFPDGTHNESIMQPGYFQYIADFIEDEVIAKK